MADFVEVTLDDGTAVFFQTAESDLVSNHAGTPDVERTVAALEQVKSIANAAGSVSRSFRERLSPDELSMEIGVGLSGEVGWFFAKSELEATIKVTLTWKSQNKVEG